MAQFFRSGNAFVASYALGGVILFAGLFAMMGGIISIDTALIGLTADAVVWPLSVFLCACAWKN